LPFGILEWQYASVVPLEDVAVWNLVFVEALHPPLKAGSPFTRKQVRTMLRVPRRSRGTGQSKKVRSVPGWPFASA
jgi:hypothetical protein